MNEAEESVGVALKRVMVAGAAMLVSAAAVQTCVAETTAAGREAVGAEAPESTQLEMIVVTGSRIPRANVASASPVTALDESAFDQTGALTVSQAMNELPQFGAGFGSRSQDFNTLNSGFGNGTELVNLRNLGAQRTLVLVNGRRHIGGDPGTSSVDLNSIPSEMIQRIDIVTGAASAVYGADAVTGVVNIILKDDFEGATWTARTGISSRDDGQDYQVSGILGGRFSAGRGFGLLSAEYTKNDGILGSERWFGRYDAANFTISPLNGSTAIPGERITGANGVFTFDAANNLVNVNSLDPSSIRFNRLPWHHLETPTQRYLISGLANYDLLEDDGGFSAKAYVETSYARAETFIQFEPLLFLLDGATFGTPAEGAISGPRVPANNPFLRTLEPIIGPIPANGVAVQTRLAEYGSRGSTINRDTFRIATGVGGNLFGSFKYDLYYQYGRVHAVQDDIGSLDRYRFFAGLDVNDNGTPGDFTDDSCADPFYVARGCTPVNIFGHDTIGQEFIDYTRISSTSVSNSTQEVVSGYISGDLFELPAGPLGVVIGAEYRKEETVVTPAQSYLDKSNSTRFLNGVDGQYDVREAFAELNVPVLADLPFIQSFELGAAVRASDYSTVGSQSSWSARGDWSINPVVRLRGVYATAVRAPNIKELFSPLSSVVTAITDPCDRVSDGGQAITLTGARSDNCLADLGALSGTLDQTQTQRQTVKALSQGDPTLEAESANTYTVGMVFTPGGAFDDLTMSLDYYDISIDDVISGLPLQDLVNQCYEQPTHPAVFCDTIARDALTGQLLSVDNKLFNAATETMSGLDLQLNYGFDLGRLFAASRGSLNLQVAWSHLFEHTFVARDGAAEDRREGQVGDFRNRLDVGLTYSSGPVRLMWNSRYLSSALADTTIASTSPLYPLSHIDAIWYHDAQATYDFSNGAFRLTLGVKNVFDKDPPLNTIPSRTAPTNFPTSGGIYDVRGRFMYVGATVHL